MSGKGVASGVIRLRKALDRRAVQQVYARMTLWKTEDAAREHYAKLIDEHDLHDVPDAPPPSGLGVHRRRGDLIVAIIQQK